MSAEQAVVRVSRDMKRYARKMGEIKNRMDREQYILEATEKGIEIGTEKERQENRQHVLDLINQGLSPEEILQRLVSDNRQ